MNRGLWRVFAQTIFFLLPAGLWAAPNSLDIEEVLTRALNESPLVKEIESKAAAKRGAGISGALLENPELDSELRFPVSYQESRGGNEAALSLSQPLRPSDFGARDRINRLIKGEAHLEQKLDLLSFSQQLKLSFVKAWAMERRQGELKKQLERAASLEAEISRAAQSGLLSASESQLFKAESLKTKYQLEAAASDASRARAELSKKAGFAIALGLVKPPLAPPPPLSQLAASGSSLPLQAKAELAAKLAKEQLKMARLDAYPRFAPRIVFERTGDYTDYLGLGISIDLPLHNRNQGEKLARSAELSAAQSTLSLYSTGVLESELSALHQSVEASRKLLQGYEDEVLPALRQALAAEERLLQAGQGSVPRVWQTLRELSAAEAETVERFVKAHSDRAELAVLTGLDF